MKKQILIIDDEAPIQESLSGILEDEGFNTICASSAEKGIEIIAEETVDLILLDIWLGDNMDGMTALEKIKEGHEHLPVIMISGHGTIETAVQATRKGAFDFIEKPLSYDKIMLAIRNGLKFSKLEEENRFLKETTARKSDITGKSPLITAVKEQIKMVGPTDAWVLIRGEHGTGKELVAQAIHRYSASSGQPMIEVNCAAIPEELIESELFGHEKGAFTGAVAMRKGRFELADSGTIFLDEVSEIPLPLQSKLLRVLQEKTFERVGGAKTLEIDVRIISASNRDLREEVAAGRFREDLFYRLNVIPVSLPALRERMDDMKLLADHFVEKSKISLGKPDLQISADALRLLLKLPWEGNIRELENTIERAAILCSENVIEAEDVQPDTMYKKDEASWGQDIDLQQLLPDDASLNEVLYAIEEKMLTQALLDQGHVQARAAEKLGITKSLLQYKMKKYGIKKKK